jgi:hypothetical protein
MARDKNSHFENLKVDSIELDLTNPRIARVMSMYTAPTSEQIALALGVNSNDEAGKAGTSYVSLKQSIKTNGGVIHPIIVNKQSNGKLIVIEGNTRVQIYKEFKEKKYSGAWDMIPAIIYDDLGIKQVDAIRLQAHLVGPRPWDPYSKAKYLAHLSNDEYLTAEQIVAYCGGNNREVKNYIEAYEDMEKYYRPILDSDQDFDQTRFSAFVELQAGRVIESLLNTGYTKSDFAEWVNDRRLSPLSSVRKLPRILRNQRSKEIFLKSGAEEALKVLDTPSQDSSLDNASLCQLLKSVIKQIQKIKYTEVKKLRDEPENEEREMLIEAKDAVVELCEEIESS